MKAWFKQFISRLTNTSHRKSGLSADYFVHIPKTAGTSFIVLLDRFYPASNIYPHQLWRDNKDIDLVANQKYQLFRGHFGGGGAGVLTDRRLEYFTILREPESLAWSTFQFVKREKNTKVHELVIQENMQFEQFLRHPMTLPLVQNRMIRNISFDFVKDPAAQEVFLSAETIAYLQSIINQQNKAISDDQRVQRSQKFIDECRWFGLLERFNESLQLLCFTMKWPPIGHTQKLNTFKQSTQLSSKERQLVKQLNQQDRRLYDYAAVVFEQRLEDMHRKLQQLQTHQSQTVDDLIDHRYQLHQATLMAGKLPSSTCYTFDQPLLGSQWHRRELMQPENDYFRWSGPGSQATIDCWLQPQDYQLSIRIINATSAELLDQLSISINGHALEWHSEDSGMVRVLHVDIPASFIKNNGLVRLCIDCHNMISHADAFESNDERLVGVAVHWLKFSHAA